MATDPKSILTYCAILAVGFWFIGLIALAIAVKQARPMFRSKGYLRTPTGTRWFRFLLLKQYDAFDQPGIRIFFGITHYCMIGTFIALGAGAVLLGSELLLKGMSGVR